MGLKTRIRIIILVATALLLLLLQAVAQDTKAVILQNEGCTIHYRNDLGCPVLVKWALNRNDIGSAKRKASWKFKTDRRAARPRVTSAMYTHSGYERGHMCPAADRSATTAQMRQTFIMTNVCPQLPRLNKGVWKQTETLARAVALSLGECSVYAAPLFLYPDTIKIAKGRISVPDAFFKTIFRADSPSFCKWFIVSNR